MARGVNKVILIGNLGKDPEIRHMANGDAVASFPVATSEQWKDKNGEKQERTEWHNVVTFKRLAEIAAEYLSKGSQVYIEGSLRTRKWEDKNGQDKYTTEVICSDMQMLGSKGSGGAGGGPQRSTSTQRQAPQRAQPQQQFDDFDDDIPF